MPEAPARHEYELDLLTALDLALRVTKGYGAPELEPVLTRAAALAQQVGEPTQRFAVLLALWSFRITRAEYQVAHAVAEQLFDLAQRQHDPTLLLSAHYALGQLSYQVGTFAPARTHWEQGIALNDPQRHATPDTIPGSTRNYGLDCRSHLALVLRTLGRLAESEQLLRQVLAIRRRVLDDSHPLIASALVACAGTLEASGRLGEAEPLYGEAVQRLSRQPGAADAAVRAAVQAWCQCLQSLGRHDHADRVRNRFGPPKASGASADSRSG